MIDGHILEHDFVPIVGRIHPRRISWVTRPLNLGQGVSGTSQRITGRLRLIVHPHISFWIHHVNVTRWHGSHRLVTNGGIYAPCLPFLRSHQNHPVRPSGPVHRRSWRILQYRKTLDIPRYHTSQVQTGRFHPVNQNQRLRRTIGWTDTPDIKLCVHLLFSQRPGSTSCLPTNDTSNFTGKRGGQVTTGGF